MVQPLKAPRLLQVTACVTVCLAVALPLAGCSTPHKIAPGFVADRWSTTLRAFNIDPIFLPRQIHLGDVYLAGEPRGAPENDANRWRRRTIYLGRADVFAAIEKDTRSRLRLPGTSAPASGDNVFAPPATVTALRPVAFPGFNVSEVRESDFAAAFPVKLFRALFGAFRRGEMVMSINIPSAEYEEVPAVAAWEQLGQFCSSSTPSVCAASSPALRTMFENMKLPNDTQPLLPKIGIVTSVYYVRQINYFYNTGHSSAFGASASRPLPTPVPLAVPGTATTSAPAPAEPAGATDSSTPAAIAAATNPAVKAVPSAGATIPAAAPANPSANPSANPAKPEQSAADQTTAALRARVDAMQKRLDELQKQTEGTDRYGAIRVVSETNEGTTLIQTFEKPVAIGYRAIWIEPLGYAGPASTASQPR